MTRQVAHVLIISMIVVALRNTILSLGVGGVNAFSAQRLMMHHHQYATSSYHHHRAFIQSSKQRLPTTRHSLYRFRYSTFLAASNSGDDDNDTTTATPTATLSMDNIYLEWTVEDDKLLHDNKHLSTVKLASLLGRGMHGVEARLKKLTDVNSVAYNRLFAGGGGGNNNHNTVQDIDNDDDDDEQQNSSNSNNKGLTPVKEVLRRIQWDPTLPSSAFTISHYDRMENCTCETPFDAPNDSISGKETQFIFALPEHRIEEVKYLDRSVWNKEMRLDCVFGSMNGNGLTIEKVIDTYEDWKREKEEREERNRLRQIEVLRQMNLIIEEKRVSTLKEISSQLMHDDEWDTNSVKDYVKGVVSLYHDAKREKETEECGEPEECTTDIIDFLYLFSDLVALLPDKQQQLREEILKDVELVIRRSLGENSTSSSLQKTSVGQIRGGQLLELNEDDLDEKFVKGQGKGGQKINKTSNRVILTHVPTQVRVECQDTRSLQQNRKIARKRLRLKVDEFINGTNSRVGQKTSMKVAKKAKNKSRNKRRQKKKSEKDDTAAS